jgi:hypothetical protein
MAAVIIIALVAGVFTGASVVWLVTRGQGRGDPVVMQSQGEIKARIDEALAQVQRLGAIFANAGQRAGLANWYCRTCWRRPGWISTGISSSRWGSMTVSARTSW